MKKEDNLERNNTSLLFVLQPMNSFDTSLGLLDTLCRRRRLRRSYIQHI